MSHHQQGDGRSQGAGATLVFDDTCPSRPVLDQIADKWSLMVLAVLDEPSRFNEIRRRVGGITQKVLTSTLRGLERNGMVQRRVLATSPVGVEYSLTPLGRSLQEPFGVLYDWTVDHIAEIRAHQEAFDQRLPQHPASQ